MDRCSWSILEPKQRLRKVNCGLVPRDPFLLESSLPGLMAAGDVRHRSVKRIASAVGEGSMAVSLIHEYLAAS